MADIIISNTSPLLYLHRIEALDWLPELGEKVWIPQAVQDELSEGRRTNSQSFRLPGERAPVRSAQRLRRPRHALAGRLFPAHRRIRFIPDCA